MIPKIKNPPIANKLKVALVGYGYWGPKLLKNLLKHPQIEVECVCDISMEQLKKVKADYPNINIARNFKQVISNKNITCVVVAVPTLNHFQVCKDIILSGKNVLVEKPMTTTLKEAVTLVKLAARKDIVLCVDHPFIFSDPVKKIKSVIDRGQLGKLYFYNSIRANLGKIDRFTNVFIDLIPHDLSILDYLLNQEQPDEIQVTGSSHILSGPKYIENGTIFLKYKSGFVANIHLNWLSPIKMRFITIAGSKKMLTFDDMQLNKLKIFDSGVDIPNSNLNNNRVNFTPELSYRLGKITNVKTDSTEPLYLVIDSFIQSVLTKKSAINDGSMGLRVVRIMEKINKAIKNSG